MPSRKKVAPVRLLCLQLFLYQDSGIEAYTSQRTIALHWCVLDTIVINFLFFFFRISSTVYGDILVVLQRLNHSLVEPWLSLVWILAPFSVSPVSLQNWSQGNEEDTPIFFVDVCIGMYTRLRQVD